MQKILFSSLVMSLATWAWCPQPGEENLTDKLSDQHYWARSSARLQKALEAVSVAQKVPTVDWLVLPERELAGATKIYYALLMKVIQDREVKLAVKRTEKDSFAVRVAQEREDVSERSRAVCERVREVLSRWYQNMDEVPVQKSDIKTLLQFVNEQTASIKKLTEANAHVFQGFLGDAPSEQAPYKVADDAFWQVILHLDTRIGELQEEITILKRRRQP